ncbi:MAG: transglycosylase domain-containing protein [Lutibacter sp.]|nr:transglycosylase domain-containing protein [Lutibacter sp.]
MRFLKIFQQAKHQSIETTKQHKTVFDSNFSFKNYTKKNWIRFFIKGVLALGVLFVIFIISVYFGLFGRVPTSKEVKLFRNMEASEVYSSDNVLLYRFDKENRLNIPFDSIPKHVVEALISSEDSRFYEHSGVDLKSLMRVIVKTVILRDKSSGGGSTISQQLVKNYFPRNSYWFLSTPINKFEEMVAAYKLESHFTKEQIVEFYFNTVPFGDTAFGIESAAQRFFSTSTSNLTIEQSAVLVGMLKATYTYNPIKFPEASKKRRDIVLNLMSQEKYISQKFKDSVTDLLLITKPKKLSRHQGKAKYFTEYVRLMMNDWLENNKKPSGKKYDLYKDGLKIYTSLNFAMQQYAEKAVAKRLKILQYEFDLQWGNEDPWNEVPIVLTNAIKNSDRYKTLKKAGLSEAMIQDSLNKPVKMKIFSHDGDRNVTMSPLDSIKNSLRFLHASFIALEPKTGHIKAYVGGIDENYFQYDHVTTKRQVGSSFKPFVYAAAIENGISPCEMYPNVLIKYPQYEDWEPKNSDYIYGGEFSVWGALAASVNTVTVQLMEKVGLLKIINLAKNMGIETELPEVPSLSLGTAELSLLEMARAYTTFPNYGKPMHEVILLKIVDREGITLNISPIKEAKNVYSEKTGEIMVEMLKRVVFQGIAAPIRYDFQLFGDIGGKTGTSQNQADGWFVGFTSNLVFGAWVGAENPAIHFKTMELGQASHTALPINGEFLRMLNKDVSFQYYLKQDFKKPSKNTLKLFDCLSRKNVPRPVKDTIADVVIDSLNIENVIIPKDSVAIEQ